MLLEPGAVELLNSLAYSTVQSSALCGGQRLVKRFAHQCVRKTAHPRLIRMFDDEASTHCFPKGIHEAIVTRVVQSFEKIQTESSADGSGDHQRVPAVVRELCQSPCQDFPDPLRE